MNDLNFSCPIELRSYDRIELGHGSGGRLMHELIEKHFYPRFKNDILATAHDGAVLPVSSKPIAVTTDSYTVKPIFFPGGNIGSLAIYGTVNDLAMCGARTRWITAGFILEEGFEIASLARILDSMATAAKECEVKLVAGDTKVVEKGHGDGIYITCTGIGEVIAPYPIGPSSVQAKDVIILSGDIGRHGIAIISTRDGLEFGWPLTTDSAPVFKAVEALIKEGIHIHCMRDLTRGGLATALCEIAKSSGLSIRIKESNIPIVEPVMAACEMLGIDPLYVANEGRFILFVPANEAKHALQILRDIPVSSSSIIIGSVEEEKNAQVILETSIGSERILDMLSGEQLPRIC